MEVFIEPADRSDGAHWSGWTCEFLSLLEVRTTDNKFREIPTPSTLHSFRFLPKNRKVMKFILEGKEKTHEIYTELIRLAEARLQANNYELQDSTNILELFLKERHTRARSTDDPEFGDSQLNHLVADIFGAGLDTTMTTIRWTLLYVARDKRIQERLDQVWKLFTSLKIHSYNISVLCRNSTKSLQRELTCPWSITTPWAI